jgi:hypothetical protein
VAVEKLAVYRIRRKLGDGKCLGDPRKSFIEHPGAILFSPNFLRGVFQQPQAITLKTRQCPTCPTGGALLGYKFGGKNYCHSGDCLVCPSRMKQVSYFRSIAYEEMDI